MRITQVIPNFGLGGIQKAGVILARNLAKKGHQVQLIGGGDGPRFVTAQKCDITASVFGDHKGLEALLGDFDPDVVHVHVPHYEHSNVRDVIRCVKAVPIVVTPVFGRPPRDAALLEQVATCCVGLYTHARLCKWLRLTAAEAVRSGIVFAEMTPFDIEDRDRYLRSSSHPRSNMEEIVFGRIGRQVPAKWHPKMPEIVGQILRDVPKARWLSVGWPHSLRLTEMKARWGGRFSNMDEITDDGRLAALMQEMDVHLFASRYGECFSSSICETASYGIPTIALLRPFNDAGEIEQVIDGVTGSLALSANELVRFARQIAEDPQRLALLRASTRRYADLNWSAANVCEVLAQMYSALLASGGRDLGAIHSFSRATCFGQVYDKTLKRGISVRVSFVLADLAFRIYHEWRCWKFARALAKAVRGIVAGSRKRLSHQAE
ncbi:glycosyltransferase family 4 protein [Congregicoccus parvus]|uniref:glycosyltransferase family 4 protein n=1 Tax=Congregicoccus parvus TaxID=3081749 RepID=UPI003FA5A612